MADLIRKMQEGHTVEDIDTVIDEVYEARGEYDSLGERLDDMEGGAPTPSTSIPAMDGTGSAGTSNQYARADHVHPSDTSKQNALTTAQLAAVNSGIDSTKVAQIETNENNILTVANQDTVYNYINSIDIATLKTMNTTGTWTDNVYKYANVEMTVNNDGTITVKTTATSTDGIGLVFPIPTLPVGEYWLIGCPVGGSAAATNGFFELYEYARNGTTQYKIDTGSGVIFDYATGDDVHTIRIAVRPQTTIATPIIFKPQIISKTLYDRGFTAYRPYAPSNTELYQMILNL